MLFKLRWTKQHSAELEKRSSTLEFKLHRQRVLQLLEGNQTQEAIAYARENFTKFGDRHTRGTMVPILDIHKYRSYHPPLLLLTPL